MDEQIITIIHTLILEIQAMKGVDPSRIQEISMALIKIPLCHVCCVDAKLGAITVIMGLSSALNDEIVVNALQRARMSLGNLTEERQLEGHPM